MKNCFQRKIDARQGCTETQFFSPLLLVLLGNVARELFYDSKGPAHAHEIQFSFASNQARFIERLFVTASDVFPFVRSSTTPLCIVRWKKQKQGCTIGFDFCYLMKHSAY